MGRLSKLFGRKNHGGAQQTTTANPVQTSVDETQSSVVTAPRSKLDLTKNQLKKEANKNGYVPKRVKNAATSVYNGTGDLRRRFIDNNVEQLASVTITRVNPDDNIWQALMRSIRINSKTHMLQFTNIWIDRLNKKNRTKTARNFGRFLKIAGRKDEQGSLVSSGKEHKYVDAKTRYTEADKKLITVRASLERIATELKDKYAQKSTDIVGFDNYADFEERRAFDKSRRDLESIYHLISDTVQLQITGPILKSASAEELKELFAAYTQWKTELSGQVQAKQQLDEATIDLKRSHAKMNQKIASSMLRVHKRESLLASKKEYQGWIRAEYKRKDDDSNNEPDTMETVARKDILARVWTKQVALFEQRLEESKTILNTGKLPETTTEFDMTRRDDCAELLAEHAAFLEASKQDNVEQPVASDTVPEQKQDRPVSANRNYLLFGLSGKRDSDQVSHDAIGLSEVEEDQLVETWRYTNEGSDDSTITVVRTKDNNYEATANWDPENPVVLPSDWDRKNNARVINIGDGEYVAYDGCVVDKPSEYRKKSNINA